MQKLPPNSRRLFRSFSFCWCSGKGSPCAVRAQRRALRCPPLSSRPGARLALRGCCSLPCCRDPLLGLELCLWLFHNAARKYWFYRFNRKTNAPSLTPQARRLLRTPHNRATPGPPQPVPSPSPSLVPALPFPSERQRPCFPTPVTSQSAPRKTSCSRAPFPLRSGCQSRPPRTAPRHGGRLRGACQA